MNTMANEITNEFVFYSDKLDYKTVVGAKGKEFFIEGYISTGDIDLVNDIVTKGCMDSMLGQFDQRSIKLDFEHETFRGKSKLEAEANKTRLPLGRAVTKDQDSKGVKVKWKMNENWKKFDEKGNVVMDFKDIWNNVENEMLDAFSIAYVPTSTKSMKREGKDVRMLDNVNLLNVALTGNPINPHATMSAVMAKSLAFMKDQDMDETANIEIKDRLKIIESEVADLKSNLSNSNVDNKNMGYKTMPEEEIKPDVDAKPSETPVEPEKPAEAPVEPEAPKPEGKSMSLTELKSIVEVLVKDIDELKKENADLKAIVEKPLQKSKGAENNETKSQVVPENKSKGPIDRIF